MPEYNDNADTEPNSASPEPGSKPMDDEAIRTALKAQIADAEDFIEQVISPQREEADKYYKGLPFGNEEDGRSKVVMTDLRDVVSSIMPSQMRVFHGPDRAVEFLPISEKDAGQAEQETDYINDIVMAQDNNGFLNDYMWFKDAFVKTTGVVKWYWDDTISTRTDKLFNATLEQVELLGAEDGVEIVTKNEHEDKIEGQKVTLYDVEFTRTAEDGRARYLPLPPEEFGFNRGAKTIEEADLVYHHSLKTTTELLEMGIDQETIDEHGGKSSRLEFNPERIARDETLQAPVDASEQDAEGHADGFGPMDRHDYWETYPRIDANGDGKAELRKVCLLGPGMHVVENEPAPERPFALIVPDPEPHTMLGLSLFDYIADLQRISSFIVRGMLDSLTQHLNPRYEAVEDQVSIPDLMNHTLGQPVRVKQPNMVRPLTTEFVGANALPVLEFFQTIRENRVGVTRASAGLDPNALQSTEKAAAAATVAAAQQRIELFARVFAETGYKPLMRGLRRLVIRHQPRARTVKLRGKWVEIDPRLWLADREVHTNVALGLGHVEDRLAVLGAIAQDQTNWLEKLGPTNPMVTLGQRRATMARILKLQGYPNSNEFYLPMDPMFQPPPAPEPPPDPAMLVAQAEVAKSQAEMQKMEIDSQFKQQEGAQKAMDAQAERENKLAIAQLQAEVDLAKLEAESKLKRLEIELKYNVDLEIARAKNENDLRKESAKSKSAGKSENGGSSGGSKTEIHLPKEITIPEMPTPQITVNVPAQPAPVVNVPAPIVNVPEPKRGKRRRKATARQNKDGSIDIESEESD